MSNEDPVRQNRGVFVRCCYRVRPRGGWPGNEKEVAMNVVSEKQKSTEVLLVEDNLGDVRLAREAFRDVNDAIRLHLASDGVEAMAFLRRQGNYLDAPRPDLIVLDLNLPKMNGREVLAQIKSDENLKMIPTVVLSSSETDADVLMSYKLQANCYLRKPAQWDAFVAMVRSINAFWLTNTKLPQKPRS
jgi:chemotaxis family two-component system response regulator Rcp1